MRCYRRLNQLHHSVYELVDINGESIELIKSCRVFLSDTVVSEFLPNRKTYVIFDDEHQLIMSAFRFLNLHEMFMSENTRLQKANALLLFHTFLSLEEMVLSDYRNFNATGFIAFLRGDNVYYGEQCDEQRVRSYESLNITLSYVRRYLKFLRYDDHPLLFSSYKESKNGNHAVSTYKYSLVRSGRKDVPKYISPEEYQLLLHAVKENEDEQSRLIMELMYGYGMRIGEVLGLTVEDIKCIKKADKRAVYRLAIRNRLSDATYQYAKGRMHVSSRAEYGGSDYKNSTQYVEIHKETFEALHMYIDQAHAHFELFYPDQFKFAEADTVEHKDADEFSNHYIFLGSSGRPLHAKVWNTMLRKYFQKCGIPTDDNMRQSGLSHRFRHGFAMLNAHFLNPPRSLLELSKLMRHSSVSSTAVYYNLTDEDKAKMYEETFEKLKQRNPGLDTRHMLGKENSEL